MKKALILLFFALPVMAGAQKSDSLICKMIADSLPQGWWAKVEKGSIWVGKTDSIWFYNGINAPLEIKPSEKPPFGANKTVYRMEIKVLPGWSQKQMKSAVKNNAAIMNKIYEKYKMSEIPNKNGDFAPRNEDEQKRVDAYYKESEKAQTELVTIPTICNEKNSFIVQSGISTGLSIWPHKAQGEIYNTEMKVYSVLRK